jgi:inosine triphosphate pyrophosphatase
MEGSSKLLFVTGNANKLREVREILHGCGFEVDSVDVDLPEFQGEPEDICREKCLEAFNHAKQPIIVEDTSLCYEALGGLPGPYIKWFLKKIGTENLPRLLDGFESKRAYALCVFAYYDGTMENPILFHGRVDGSIVEPRGLVGGFGWDPIFEPEGSSKT